MLFVPAALLWVERRPLQYNENLQVFFFSRFSVHVVSMHTLCHSLVNHSPGQISWSGRGNTPAFRSTSKHPDPRFLFMCSNLTFWSHCESVKLGLWRNHCGRQSGGNRKRVVVKSSAYVSWVGRTFLCICCTWYSGLPLTFPSDWACVLASMSSGGSGGNQVWA